MILISECIGQFNSINFMMSEGQQLRSFYFPIILFDYKCVIPVIYFHRFKEYTADNISPAARRHTIAKYGLELFLSNSKNSFISNRTSFVVFLYFYSHISHFIAATPRLLVSHSFECDFRRHLSLFYRALRFGVR